MKLLRYGPVGQEKPGLLDAEGRIRDLSDVIADLGPEQISPESLAELAKIDVESLPLVHGEHRYGVPVAGTRQFIAIGLNFADHAEESKMAIPKEPVVFTKAITTLVGPNDDVMIPPGSVKTDWEVELGVVIGKQAEFVEEAEALDYVAGFCTINDVSEREYQMERGGTWDKGKGFPTHGPVGPWLVTKDEVGDFNDLHMWLEVNGRRMQNGSSKTMIFKVPELISYLSRFMRLLPGDIITTGTPPGVGFGQNPQWYLKEGDVVRLGIEKLGEQQQNFIAWRRGA